MASLGPPQPTPFLPNRRPRRALVVLQAAPLRRLFGMALEDLGYTVTAVANAEEAAPYLTADLAVAVVDLVMHASGGQAVCARLRALAPTVPVVVLCSRYYRLARSDARAGVVELVVPFELAELEATVAQAVLGSAA